MMDSEQTCMFFIDDSNIWIEAQKFRVRGNTHMPAIIDSDRDPRLRINIGKLLHELGQGRERVWSFLYGSRPPPNDSVWEAFKRKKFQVKIFDRSFGGKEKEVDNAMSADIAEMATELRVESKYSDKARQKMEQTVFVVVSGDRDMLPAVRKVLTNGIAVEVWAWRSNISNGYLQLSSTEARIEVRLLDDIFTKIFFTNFRSTRKAPPDCTKSIVLVFAEAVQDYDAICDLVNTQGRIFYMRKTPVETELIIEFKNDLDLGKAIGNLQNLLGSVATVIDWPQYTTRHNNTVTPIFDTGNMFMPIAEDGNLAETELPGPLIVPFHSSLPTGEMDALQERDVTNIGRSVDGDSHSVPLAVDQPDASQAGDADGWVKVVRHDQAYKHFRKNNQERHCTYGIRCAKRGQCSSKHTNQERTMFQDPDNARVDFAKWKTQPCNYGDSSCYKTRERCPYFHTNEEAWCMRCHCEGHSMLDCYFVQEQEKESLRKIRAMTEKDAMPGRAMGRRNK
ncbi:hypothetical protein F503_08677 [Ophiostoma piceae UAMH 11346]|uniref:NYN domain-containing protein n=1 Tax=Ophiostoma piceae (strain UAMH 11346) TaxID=1262450 RepID=S3CA00_OPHP1|nr:hypothetical protein F503_08677 [Ophiostoma piceae UAMH 11346]